MYRTAYGLLASAVLLIGAGGCTDITTEPKSTVTSENIFNDTRTYRAFIAKLYAGLAVSGQEGPHGAPDIEGIDEGFSQYIRGLWQLQELPTDEAVIGWGDESLPELNTGMWGSANRFTTAFYYRIFIQVALANSFLRETSADRLASRGVGEPLLSQIEEYRAEARFLRALSYWHGIDLFGDIPFVPETEEPGVRPPEQSTRQEIFDYVVSELNEIRNELPLPGQGQYGRADQGAVLMLLSKLYMNAEAYGLGARYAEARAAVEAVINSGAYQLNTNYHHNFLADNHNSPELIFVVPFDGMHTRTWGGTTFLTHASVGGNMNPAEYGLNGGWWGLRVTQQLANLFPDVPGPDRRAAIFFTDGQSRQVTSISDFAAGYAAPKYQNVTSTGAQGSHLEFPDTDYPMFRLADAYLTYAEAVLRGGGGTRAQALEYVNRVRQRAYGNTSGNITDAQLTLDFILDERARELFWEGHRRTDLIRYDRFTGASYLWAWKGGVQGGQALPDFRVLYPIPASELLANPNLRQNEGY